MLFGKRHHEDDSSSSRPKRGRRNEPEPGFHRIDFDMMVKGNIYKRRSGDVRQYGVTVNGATRLVTSGDVVDNDTFNALVAAGVVRPKPEEKAPKKDKLPPAPPQPDAKAGPRTPETPAHR